MYDGDGTRFSRQIGAGSPIRYVSDVNRSLPVTIDDGTRKYVYGLGLAYAVSGTTLEVYHPDRLGSTRAITDAAGAVAATYRTDEWGVPTTTTGSSTQPFRFTGEPQDATGLVYLRARYYDPSLGRFLSRDNWPGYSSSSQSLDRYAYATNNPTTMLDRSGHKAGVLEDPCQFVDPMAGCYTLDQAETFTKIASVGAVGAVACYLACAAAVGVATEALLAAKDRIQALLQGPALQGPITTAQTIGTFVTKADARAGVSSLGLQSQQLQSVLNAISRATSSTTIAIAQDGENIVVNLTRPGADGYQLFQSIISSTGSSTVIQYAYNAAGQLVHVDPKDGG